MHLFYFDESGDSGYPQLVNSPTRFFVLSCIVVPQASWRPSLDKLIELRSRIKRRYGVRVRGEIKATDFHRGKGAFIGHPLQSDRDERMKIYRGIMAYQKTHLPDIRVFAIAIDKKSISKVGRDVRTIAWQFALQRVDKYLSPHEADSDSGDLGMVFPDHGHGDMIRKLMRQVRRFQQIRGHFGGTLDIPTERIVEDPNDRKSHDSLFVQLADWNALACHRSVYVDPNNTIPDDLWDTLGPIRLDAVNSLTGGPPGIVKWPT